MKNKEYDVTMRIKGEVTYRVVAKSEKAAAKKGMKGHGQYQAIAYEMVEVKDVSNTGFDPDEIPF